MQAEQQSERERTPQCCKPQWRACCCNCASQLRVSKHPWNKVVGKGEVSLTMGWVCTAGTEDGSSGTFFEHQHGLCEVHEERRA